MFDHICQLNLNILYVKGEDFTLTYNGKEIPIFISDYVLSTYGTGADAESYKKYYEVCTIANAYYDHYANSLTFNSKELRAYEADKLYKYYSYSYEVYYPMPTPYPAVWVRR